MEIKYDWRLEVCEFPKNLQFKVSLIHCEIGEFAMVLNGVRTTALLVIFLINLFLFNCCFGKSEKKNPFQNKFSVGDKLVVGQKMLNIYSNPDKTSEIMDIQESGMHVTVQEIKPEWIQVLLAKKGLLREQDGEFTGWALITDIENLTKLGTTASRSDQYVQMSGHRT